MRQKIFYSKDISLGKRFSLSNSNLSKTKNRLTSKAQQIPYISRNLSFLCARRAGWRIPGRMSAYPIFRAEFVDFRNHFLNLKVNKRAPKNFETWFIKGSTVKQIRFTGIRIFVLFGKYLQNHTQRLSFDHTNIFNPGIRHWQRSVGFYGIETDRSALKFRNPDSPYLSFNHSIRMSKNWDQIFIC